MRKPLSIVKFMIDATSGGRPVSGLAKFSDGKYFRWALEYAWDGEKGYRYFDEVNVFSAKTIHNGTSPVKLAQSQRHVLIEDFLQSGNLPPPEDYAVELG